MRPQEGAAQVLLRLLVVEDCEDNVHVALRHLRSGGYDPQWERVDTRDGLLKALDTHQWDAIICGYTLSHFDALSALQVVKGSGRDIPFIIVSGENGEDTAVAAIKAGAHDYVMKDRLARLPEAIEREIRDAKTRLEHERTRKQRETTLASLELTVRAAGAGTWEWDLITGQAVWSPRMFELLGLDPNTCVASLDAWRSVLHPDDSGLPERHAKQALAEHTLLSGDYRVVLPNGSVRWVNFVGEGIYDGQARPIRMTGLCWDITHRKELERAIQENEVKYRTVVENVFEGVIVFSNGQKKFTNRRYREIIGYSEKEFSSLDFMAAVHPDDRVPVQQQLTALMQTGATISGLQCRVITKQGEIRWLEASGSRIEWEGVPSVIVFAEDITHRKQVQERLQESEKRYRSLFDAGPDGIVLIGTNGRILDANVAQARMYNFKSVADLVGLPATELVAASSRDESAQNLRRRLNGEDLPPVEYELIRTDGTTFFGEVSATVLRETNGSVSGYMCLTHDISKRLNDEAVLRESEAKFRAAFMTGPDAFYWATMLDGRIFEVNERFEAIYGYTREEVIGRTSLELGLYVDASDCERLNSELRENGIVKELELPCRRKDGQIITVSLSGSTVVQSSQLFLLGVIRDITERKLVEEKIKNYQLHLEAMVAQRAKELEVFNQLLFVSLESASVGAWWINFEEHDTYHALDTTAKLMGMPVSQSADKAYRISDWVKVLRETQEIVPEYSGMVENTLERFAGTISGKYETYRVIYPVVLPDRSTRWIDARADVSTRDRDGNALMMTGTLIDVTKLIEVEKVLTAHKSHLEALVTQRTEELAERNHELQLATERLVLATSGANIGVWDWDIPRNELIWDDAMYDHYGIRRDDFGGAYEAWSCAIHPEDRARTDEEINAALRGDREYAPEFRIVRPDGSIRHMQASSVTFRSPDGKPIRMVGVNFDTTERKLAEKALNEAQTLHSSIINSTTDMIWSVDPHAFGLLSFNRGLSEYFLKAGVTLQVGMRPEDIFPTEEFSERWTGLYRRALAEQGYRAEYTGLAGNAVLQLTFGILRRNTEVFGISVFAKDVSESKRAERELQERLQLEMLVADLAARFVAVDVENLDREILFALQRISECIDIDICGIWQLADDDPSTLALTHMYSGMNNSTIPAEMLARDYFPWVEEKLRETGRSFMLSEPSELPLDAIRDREVYSLFGIESALCVPSMDANGKLSGVVACNCTTRRTWTPLVVNRVEMLARIILLALARVRAERRMAAGNERMRLLTEMLDEAPAGVVVRDEAGNLLYANRYVATLHGYDVSEFERLSVLDLIAPNWRSEHDQRTQEALEHGECTFKLWHLKKDGSAVHLSIVSRRVLWLERAAILSVQVDLTDQERASRALRESEERYRLLAERVADVVWVLDPGTGKCLYISPSVERLRGYTVEEAMAEPLEASLAPDSREIMRAQVQQALRQLTTGIHTESFGVYVVHQIRRDGSTVPTEVTMECIRDQATGKPLILGVSRDITERMQAEVLQKDLQQQLLQAQKMEAIGSLAGGVAHDFNNLLSVILNFTGFAMDGARKDESLTADLLEVRKAADRAVALTRQLLAFSRKQVLQPIPLSLNQVTTGIEKMLRRILGEDVEFVLVLAPDLGLTMADPGQVEQVLMNLVVNARDAMPGGGTLIIETSNVTVDVEFTESHLTVKPGHYVQLTVTDTGTGMDEQTRARIFEPFFTTKQVGKGTGLGLSTVYGIVKQSGGDIWVYSELGQGTTFKVYLPREMVATTAMSARPQATPTQVTGTETILVVEDEDALRRVAKRALTAVGYQVLVAANGEEALQTFVQHDGDIPLLLTDVVMPRMSGRSLADQLKIIRPTLKVLYMSGYTDDAIDRHGVLDAGTQFLPKPFTGVQLTRKVREVLDSDVIQVVYERAPAVEAHTKPQMLEKSAIGALPPDLVTKLRNAVIAARYDEVFEIIESIRKFEPTIATGLQQMADLFDSDGLRDLLSSQEEEHHG